MTYQILATWQNGKPEVVDETEDLDDAKYLRREYQIAYGFDVIVQIKKVR